MKPPPFAYRRASSLDEALALVADAGDEAKLLAGGQSLLPLLAYRLARPTHLIDIGRLPGLSGIRPESDGLVIGGLVRHAQLERSAGLVGPWGCIREAAALIGHYPIRVRGTFGGSISHADPSAELPVVCIALGATFIVRSAEGMRSIPAEEFFLGPFMTVLEPTEALVEIRFPAARPGLRSAFEEFSPRVGDFAFASTAVALAIGEDGIVQDVRIALGGVGATPFRVRAAETILEGSALTADALTEVAHQCATVCDPAGDPEFRRDLVKALVTRALRRLMGDQ